MRQTRFMIDNIQAGRIAQIAAVANIHSKRLQRYPVQLRRSSLVAGFGGRGWIRLGGLWSPFVAFVAAMARLVAG